MVIRSLSLNPAAVRERGAITIQMLVILGPVILLLMGFAIDLGRLYLIRGELKQATNAMALAAASRLQGTDVSIENSTAAMRLALTNANGLANRYNFSSASIGESAEGFLASEIRDPEFYDTAGAASGEDAAAATGQSGPTTSKYVRVSLTADAPLIFFGLLSLGQERKTPIASLSVAGQSAPLCQACGIENLAIAALDASDTVNFGFSVNTRYTLRHQCLGNPQPQPLGNAPISLNYLVINRFDEASTNFSDPSQQLFRIGQNGLPGNTVAATGCLTINAAEGIWAGSEPLQCQFNQTPGPVRALLCGLGTRFDPNTLAAQCSIVPDVDTLAGNNIPDTDLTDLDDYAAYTGNGRRIITIPIVDALAPGGGMLVLGFRQFLVQPLPGGTEFAAGDPSGRFVASYIGSVMPLRQGRFDGNCGATSGPGKVVLYR